MAPLRKTGSPIFLDRRYISGRKKRCQPKRKLAVHLVPIKDAAETFTAAWDFWFNGAYIRALDNGKAIRQVDGSRPELSRQRRKLAAAGKSTGMP